MFPILACKLLEAGSMTATSFYPQKCLENGSHSKSSAKRWTDLAISLKFSPGDFMRSPSKFILIVINVCFNSFWPQGYFY